MYVRTTGTGGRFRSRKSNKRTEERDEPARSLRRVIRRPDQAEMLLARGR
jgi:ribosomal protein L24E